MRVLSAALACALAAQQAVADKCYALALSSGDQSSMYQAGVLSGFAQTYDASEMAYQAVSGVSGGAVNAAILASYEVGQESTAVDRMKTFWENSADTKMYKDWLGGLAEGLLLKGGLWNDAATLDFIRSEMADMTPSQRWIDVGLTDVLKGSYSDFYSANLTGEDLYQVMYAQFAQAGIFPPVQYNSTDYFDGSTIWDLDIFSVVNRCQDQGYADEDIVVDVVLTSEKNLKQVDASDYKSLQMLWRYLEVSRYYSNMDGLLRAQFAYPNITFRNVVAPSDDLPSSFYPLNLDRDQVDTSFNLGVTDGIASAQGTDTVENVTQFYSLKRKQDASVQNKTYEDFLSLKQNGSLPAFNLHEDKQMAAMFLN